MSRAFHAALFILHRGMEPDDVYILDAVLNVVSRYGIKRTTMADIARAAGVSRQTLYDRFSDKDRIMAAAIDLLANRVCTQLRAAFAEEADLATSLDTYFRIAIWPTYEIVQEMPDAADFQKGSGSATLAAIQRVAEAKQAILAARFQQHLPVNSSTPEDVASFFEQASCQAKMSGMAREDLEQFLAVLKASVLALAQNS